MSVCLCHIYMRVRVCKSVCVKSSCIYSQNMCVCVRMCVGCMPCSPSLSSSRMGNSNNNHKTDFIFSVWGEATASPPCHHFPTRSANQPLHTHTHACTQTLLCAVPQARAIVRVITWSVVCLVTFSLYELRAFHSPSILSIDSNLVCLCVCLCLWVRMWLPFSFYQQIGHRVPHYLANWTI